MTTRTILLISLVCVIYLYEYVNAHGPYDHPTVHGPSSAVDENIAVYDGETGTIIKDGGKSINDVTTGPASATDENITVYDGATGKVLKDGGISINDVVVGPVTSNNNSIVTFDGGTGKLVQDGGMGADNGTLTGVKRMDMTAPNTSTTPLTINGVTDQTAPLFLVQDSNGNLLFKIWHNGHTESIEGVRTTAVDGGIAFWSHINGENVPEHTNQSGWYDHTGGIFERIFTKTSGDDFTQADADDGSWIFFTGVDCIGKVAEIEQFISSTQVVIGDANWSADIGSGASPETFYTYKHPSFVSLDGAIHEFSVEQDGLFEVVSYQFIGRT